MFYQCKNCQKTWQYPIEKCPQCFATPQRMDQTPYNHRGSYTGQETIRVIGVSKTTIPTLLHPKTPYFVLILEDDKGNRWAHKSTKEYKIGEDFVAPRFLDKDGGQVAVWRIKYDILEAIEKVIELVGPLSIGQSSRALILPTLISAKHPYLCENTSPQFLESAILYLTQRGVKTENIKVAGRSAGEPPVEVSAKKSGLLDICLKNKVQFLDLAKVNSEDVFNSDIIINLPIMKVGQASASENLLRTVKKEHFPSCLTLAEAQAVQKENKLISFLGITLASFNPLNLDRVFAEITMVKPLPKSLEKVNIEGILIVGRMVEELQYEVGKLGP